LTRSRLIHIPTSFDLNFQDEIFHITQTQRYCAGEWTTWDPKITTFPGLYIYAALVQKAYALMLPYWPLTEVSLPEPCSMEALRWSQLPIAIGLAIAVLKLLRKIYSELPESESVALVAASILFFPPLYFYNFMFYTDTISLFWVLMTYIAAINARLGKPNSPMPGRMTAFFGTLAILCRQTNIVWLFFAVVHTSLLPQRAEIDLKQWRQDRSDATARPDVIELGMQEESPRPFELGWRPELAHVKSVLFSPPRLGSILINHAASLLVALAFVAFVYWNGGVVVGDREHHVPVKHWAQFLYWTAFVLFGLCMPSLIVHVVNCRERYRSGRKFAKLVLAFISLSALSWWIVKNFTYVHEFILADNRHFIFYIRRKLGSYSQWVTPLYAFATIALFVLPQFTKNVPLQLRRLGTLLLFICTALTIVPSKLVEFRYYLIPATLYYLYVHDHVMYINTSRWPRGLYIIQVLAFMLVNSWLLNLYLNKPFVWDDGTTARFMF